MAHTEVEEGVHLLPHSECQISAIIPSRQTQRRHHQIFTKFNLLVTLCSLCTIIAFADLYITLKANRCVPAPSVDIEFKQDLTFQSLSSEHDQKWEDLVTPNGGFFFANNATGDLEAYGISMFHQLHCLSMVRRALQQNDDNAANSTQQARSPKYQLNMKHVLHCMDFIRQALLCQADDTVEPVAVLKNGKREVNGMIWRQCKDSGALYKKSLEAGPNPWQENKMGSAMDVK